MGKGLQLDEFKKALDHLDNLLANTESIEINAIGGFALMHHGLRKNGLTMDIDSVTEDWNAQVVSKIEQTSKELGLPMDWLNNTNVMDDIENVNLALNPFWERSVWKFKNIKLYVADIETLFRAKMLAASDAELTGRNQDFPDLIDIAESLGVKSFDDFVSTATDFDIDVTDPVFGNLHKDLKNWYSKQITHDANSLSKHEEEIRGLNAEIEELRTLVKDLAKNNRALSGALEDILVASGREELVKGLKKEAESQPQFEIKNADKDTKNTHQQPTPKKSHER